jgi:hypothetical protein
MKVVDTEGLNYRQNQRGKRKRSHVGEIVKLIEVVFGGSEETIEEE